MLELSIQGKHENQANTAANYEYYLVLVHYSTVNMLQYRFCALSQIVAVARQYVYSLDIGTNWGSGTSRGGR
jgi:hypothetical protein